MQVASLYGSFNARWLSPADVAKTFVPMSEFRQLVQTTNSLLMGPRGCGKTTLLKMLTLDARRHWIEHRLRAEPQLEQQVALPDFTAIYIPSDTRWAYELAGAETAIPDDHFLSSRVQRCLISLSALSDALAVFETLVEDDSALDHGVAVALIDHWKERSIIPTIAHVRIRLRFHAAALRSSLNSGASGEVAKTLAQLPPALSGHAVDAVSMACMLFEATVSRKHRPRRWALCFDELETAPQWLQKELLMSLRNLEQRFLLKLTWTPVLPELLAQAHERAPNEKQDFAAIRLWESHVGASKEFCANFTQRILENRLKTAEVTPTVMFGRSRFASDDDPVGPAYHQGAEFWTLVRTQAVHDPILRSYLSRRGVNPDDPYTDDIDKRNEVIRKIKPILILRDAFLDETLGRRPRKRTSLYAGEEAIYAMSEGNPRWLAGVVNDLVDVYLNRGVARGIPLIDAAMQDEVLGGASARMLAMVKHFPIGDGPRRRSWSAIGMYDLVVRLGKLCQAQLTGDFTDEPVGSFEVDSKLHPRLVMEIERGLLIGAFIAVSRTPHDPVGYARGSRIRLSLMLAPHFGLLLRNYRWISLSTAIGTVQSRETPLLDQEEE